MSKVTGDCGAGEAPAGVRLTAALGRFVVSQLGNWAAMAIELPDKLAL
jgi:hypothetical protein